ncbi:hypothetical protein L1987_47716 [Smallanthus sonchifolius]|uniref:Uncharacterized protein n=1 Tax=Smallanthus sonchifolius TaxID=185202 RepID=A0ACB9G3Y8_9ASTR|nr:hypothetical protein L1987_47716 [Smallanthus sonchifolius]
MGKPKKRWTSEEETALFAGVNKYGTGKWKDILTDKEFAHCLIKRSNVDLKIRFSIILSCEDNKTIPFLSKFADLKMPPIFPHDMENGHSCRIKEAIPNDHYNLNNYNVRPWNTNTVEAASYADNVKVLMAGNLLHNAKKACKEVERLETVSEESVAILQMAGEL